MNFNPEDLRNLLVFLNRVQLSGQEADILVMLKLKLRTMLEKTPATPTDPPAGEDKLPKPKQLKQSKQ